MAKFFPALHAIKKEKRGQDEIEMQVLSFLDEHLNEDFEVFWRPCYHGCQPDIVVVGKNLSVLLLQIKTWKLSDYEIDLKNRLYDWYRKGERTRPLLSPLMQTRIYRDALRELWPDTPEVKIQAAVFFALAESGDVFRFLHGNVAPDIEYFGLLEEIKTLGGNAFADGSFYSLLKYFSESAVNADADRAEKIYAALTGTFKPHIHEKKQGRLFIPSKEQAALLESVGGKRQKIRGVAGSGKTVVMCRRAVNAQKRTKQSVLILSRDPSLKNYIRDKINDVQETFDWRQFLIASYEEFFRVQANNHNLKVSDPESFSDVRFFEPVEKEIRKFEAVFLDEVLDYPQEWIDVITAYFIDEQTEFVVFGDEKQSPEGVELDGNKEPVIRKIGGNWNRSLKTVYRYGKKINAVAQAFAEEFLSAKYGPETSESFNQPLKMGTVRFFFRKANTAAGVLTDEILLIAKELGARDEQIAILDSGVFKYDTLREIDGLIRKKRPQGTMTTIETQEEYKKYKDSKKALKGIVELRKKRFDVNAPLIKLSTIKSFKGLEADTVFLLIEKTNENHELIYVGLTRPQRNLIIFNLGNRTYDRVFQKMIERGVLQET
jgi:hypothetical protein